MAADQGEEFAEPLVPQDRRLGDAPQPIEGPIGQALAAVDGSKFKAVNIRDKNFTATKLKKRMEQVAERKRCSDRT